MMRVLALVLVSVCSPACGPSLPFDAAGTYSGAIERDELVAEGQSVHVRTMADLIVFDWPSSPCEWTFAVLTVEPERLTYALRPTVCVYLAGSDRAAQELAAVDGLIVVTSTEIEATIVLEAIGRDGSRRSRPLLFVGERVTP